MNLENFKHKLFQERQAVDAVAFFGLIFDTSPMRKFWIIVNSFFLGFFFSASLFLPYSPAIIPILLIYIMGILVMLMLERVARRDEKMIAQVVQPKPKPLFTNCGAIYIMRRSDGVLKFGKAKNLASRLSEHRKDYQAHFDVVSSWIVPDMDRFEAMALSLTRDYFYREAQRRELRQMTEAQLTQFILEFTDKVHRGWIQ